MKPVWIRYYGVLPMTKRGYLIALAGAAFFALVVFLVGGVLGYLPPVRTLWSPIRSWRSVGWVVGSTTICIGSS